MEGLGRYAKYECIREEEGDEESVVLRRVCQFGHVNEARMLPAEMYDRQVLELVRRQIEESDCGHRWPE
jgi:hypothetical protein